MPLERTEMMESLCACTSLRKASRAVCHLYDLVLAPTGIRSTQFSILKAISEAGPRLQMSGVIREEVGGDHLAAGQVGEIGCHRPPAGHPDCKGGMEPSYIVESLSKEYPTGAKMK